MSSGVPTCWRRPRSITAMRSPSVIASTWSWVTKIIVVSRRACSRFSSARSSARSLASRFESGSSSRKATGSRMSARPMATRWRCPPESWAGLRPRSSVSSSISATSATLPCHVGPRHPAPLERERQVLADGHVRIEGVALEHHRDVASRRRQARDVATRRSRSRPRWGARARPPSEAPSTSRTRTGRPAPSARRRPRRGRVRRPPSSRRRTSLVTERNSTRATLSP